MLIPVLFSSEVKLSRYFSEWMLTEKVWSASLILGNCPCNVRARVPLRDAYKETGNSTFREFGNLLLGEIILWTLLQSRDILGKVSTCLDFKSVWVLGGHVVQTEQYYAHSQKSACQGSPPLMLYLLCAFCFLQPPSLHVPPLFCFSAISFIRWVKPAYKSYGTLHVRH